jgi:uncharacterized protein (TIGR00369 family)
MRRINPDYVEAVRREVNRSAYFDLISMEIMTLGWGECRMEVAVHEKHLQPFGVVHGGVCSSLVDATEFWAVYSRVDEGVGMTTVELKLNYLEPASEGILIARGKSLRVGKSLCLGEASVENEEGALIAHGTSTMMLLGDLKLQGASKWPRKFLD